MEIHDPSSNVDESIDYQDDEWSQQVEQAESTLLSTSVLAEEVTDEDRGIAPILVEDASPISSTPPLAPRVAAAGSLLDSESSVPGLAPQRPEPTLKEKLVERERQRRVETEMARLKRQFALSSNGGAILDEDYTGGLIGGAAVRENGSVAGTVGEGSSVAFHEPDDEKEEQKLTYPMERFLQQQGNVKGENPSIEADRELLQQGVVMERFLLEPVVVGSPEPRAPDAARSASVDRTVSFDMVPMAWELETPVDDDVNDENLETRTPVSMPSFDDSNDGDLNASVEVMASVGAGSSVGAVASGNEDRSLDEDGAPEVSLDISHSEPGSLLGVSIDHSSISEPRVLRLTEAEIQEMAAIEEASRSNAPPSERDDISDSSFVGELVSDFGGPTVDPAGTLSQGTPTTVMESASMASGNQSARPSSSHIGDQNSLDGIGTASISSHLEVSSAGGSVSVTANPPSEIAEPQPPSPIPDEIHSVDGMTEVLEEKNEEPVGQQETVAASAPGIPTSNDCHPIELDTSDGPKNQILNRRIRPGMVGVKSLMPATAAAPQSPLRRAASVPGKMNFDVDGFDYDKHNPMSPRSGLSDSVRDLPPDDIWSPCGKMAVSPLQTMRRSVAIPSPEPYEASSPKRTLAPSTYRTCPIALQKAVIIPALPDTKRHAEFKEGAGGDTQALLQGVPPDNMPSPPSYFGALRTLDRSSIRSAMEGIFGDIRSQSTGTSNVIEKDGESYIASSTFDRVFPARLLSLAVTLLIEIPVLLIVTGRSDRLLLLIGRSKYQLLMGLLPLTSAISGNVGLQASTLTTRAICHGNLTADSYWSWLLKEVEAAAYLAIGVGSVLGFVAFCASVFDFKFAIAVMTAQFVSIIIAGITGTLAPLLFSHSAKWGWPLETACQDVIGAFTMIVLSHRILEFFGSGESDASDTCGTRLSQ